MIESLEQLEAWYRTPLGQSVFLAEKDKLAQALPHLFGYTLLQIGCVEHQRWTEASAIPHKVYLNCLMKKDLDTSLISLPEALPFPENSVDVVLLPHVLEFCESPFSLLEEFARVIVPEGVLVLLLFNQCSLFRLTHLFSRELVLPDFSPAFRMPDIRDFLADLNFETLFFSSFFFRPPIQNVVWLKRLMFLETLGQLAWPYPGAIHLIVAKRKITTMTIVRPHFAWHLAEQEYAQASMSVE